MKFPWNPMKSHEILSNHHWIPSSPKSSSLHHSLHRSAPVLKAVLLEVLRIANEIVPQPSCTSAPIRWFFVGVLDGVLDNDSTVFFGWCFGWMMFFGLIMIWWWFNGIFMKTNGNERCFPRKCWIPKIGDMSRTDGLTYWWVMTCFDHRGSSNSPSNITLDLDSSQFQGKSIGKPQIFAEKPAMGVWYIDSPNKTRRHREMCSIFGPPWKIIRKLQATCGKMGHNRDDTLW